MKIMVQAFDDLQIRIFDLSGDFAIKSIEIAMEKDITVYDASYVALAVTLNAIMYTADEKLLNRVKDFNCVKYIKELREALDAFPTQ
jgi:predicted nucleic acid-binding protein